MKTLKLEPSSAERIPGTILVRMQGAIGDDPPGVLCIAFDELNEVMTNVGLQDVRRAIAGRDWRRRTTDDLRALLALLDEGHDLAEDILEELRNREEAEGDPRVAQAMGAARGEEPS